MNEKLPEASAISTSAIWVVDDDSSIRWVLVRALEQAGHTVTSFENGEQVTQRMDQGELPAVIITDIRMPGLGGIELLDYIQRKASRLPVIIMTAHTDLDSAVSSFRGGAYEYLPKPFDIDRAVELIERASHQPAVAASGGRANSAGRSGAIIGEAPAMQEVFRAIGRLSGSDVNVLICGESGTGKELVARSIYETSPRAGGNFVALNMAAIPAELLESELFGHEKGAFTGATERRAGRFEQADGGTLFLDEIGDMPAQLQTRLLRVLSDGCFYRVGGRDQIQVDARIIAATNQDLESQVAQGHFREDLFHRLNVIRISVPSLRSRREDIPTLVDSFLSRLANEMRVDRKLLDDSALRMLRAFDWPGNVRQLENICRWITVMAPAKIVSLGDLPNEVRRPGRPRLEEGTNGSELDWTAHLRHLVEQKLDRGDTRILDTLNPEFERLMIETALRHTHGHKQEAARRLGWGRNTLTRKLKELNIQSGPKAV